MFKIGDTRRRDRHTPLLPPVLSSFFFLLPSFLPSSAYSSSSSLASLCFAYVGPHDAKIASDFLHEDEDGQCI